MPMGRCCSPRHGDKRCNMLQRFKARPGPARPVVLAGLPCPWPGAMRRGADALYRPMAGGRVEFVSKALARPAGPMVSGHMALTRPRMWPAPGRCCTVCF